MTFSFFLVKNELKIDVKTSEKDQKQKKSSGYQ